MTPSEPRRLHPLSPFFDLLLLGRQLLAPILVALFAGRRSDQRELLFAVPVVLGALFGALRWWRFTYAFDGARLVIDEGVLTRKRRVIPLDRIQQVETRSLLRHRLLGVTVLRVDTAGTGEKAEVDLSVVSVAEAARLRAILQPREAQPTTTSEHREDGALVRLSVGRLAVAGMTGAELAVMLTLVGTAFQLVDDLSLDVVEGLDGRVGAPSGAPAFAGVVAVVLVVWFGLAAIAAVVKHFGFELRRVGDDVRVQRGLFDRREASIPVRRLQWVGFVESIVRRPLGLGSVSLQSAGGSKEGSGGVSRIDVPLVGAAEAGPLLRRLLPVGPGWSLDRLGAHPPAARRRAVVRHVVVALVVGMVPAALLGVGARGVAVLSLAVVVGVLAGELAYEALGHAADADVVTTRSGLLARQTDVVPAGKVQSTRLRSSPLQRRAGLATLHLDVAGKGRMPAVVDADAGALEVLQHALVRHPGLRHDEAEARTR